MTILQTLQYLAHEIGEVHFGPNDLAQDPESAQYEWMQKINEAIAQIEGDGDRYQVAHNMIQDAKQTIINLEDADPILLNVGVTLLDQVQIMLGTKQD